MPPCLANHKTTFALKGFPRCKCLMPNTQNPFILLMMPDRQRVLIIVGVDGLEPAVPQVLLGGHAGIVTPLSVTISTRAIGAHHPHKVGDGIDQDTDVVFGLLFLMNIGAGAKPLDDLA